MGDKFLLLLWKLNGWRWNWNGKKSPKETWIKYTKTIQEENCKTWKF